MSYKTNVFGVLDADHNFRKVLYTGEKSQLVVMEIPVGGEVGEEVHDHVEQTLFFKSGTGKVVLDGKEDTVEPGDVVVVRPGVKHNFINTGTEAFEIVTVYAPPNHLDGRVHASKADADADEEDEAFGHSIT